METKQKHFLLLYCILRQTLTSMYEQCNELYSFLEVETVIDVSPKYDRRHENYRAFHIILAKINCFYSSSLFSSSSFFTSGFTGLLSLIRKSTVLRSLKSSLIASVPPPCMVRIFLISSTD